MWQISNWAAQGKESQSLKDPYRSDNGELQGEVSCNASFYYIDLPPFAVLLGVRQANGTGSWSGGGKLVASLEARRRRKVDDCPTGTCTRLARRRCFRSVLPIVTHFSSLLPTDTACLLVSIPLTTSTIAWRCPITECSAGAPTQVMTFMFPSLCFFSIPAS